MQLGKYELFSYGSSFNRKIIKYKSSKPLEKNMNHQIQTWDMGFHEIKAWKRVVVMI